MLATIGGFVLVLIGLASLSLQRFYSCVPAKELKRLAARGDGMAAVLYRPVAFGASLRLLLWLVVGLCLSGGLLLCISALPPLVAFGLVGVVLAAAVLVQSLRLTVHSARFAVWVAPGLAGLLHYVHAPLDVVSHATRRFRKHAAHSGLYEKEDMIALLQQQQEQADNRIAQHDLELLYNAAQFDDHFAADVLLPMSRVKLVSVDDHIGPVLLGELHASGQNSFLVYEGSADHVVGTLFLRDAVQARDGGRVADLMHPRLCFVHEDFSLRQVLRALARTSQSMVVVVNAFEEPVGVITLQQLLQQLIGERAEEDFDAFENRAAVAAFRLPVPQPQAVEVPIADDGEGLSSPEPPEMIK